MNKICLKQKNVWEYQRDYQNRKSKDKQYNWQIKRINKTKTGRIVLHSRLKIEQHEPHEKPEVNPGSLEGPVLLKFM